MNTIAPDGIRKTSTRRLACQDRVRILEAALVLGFALASAGLPSVQAAAMVTFRPKQIDDVLREDCC